MKRYLQKIPGQVYLWIAVLIFGASGSITRKLTQIGAYQFINGHNPISLCNVLFVGNICAFSVMVTLYHQQLTSRNLKKITKTEWKYLSLVAILSGALAPAAVFQALALSPVNNIILLGRLEFPLVLIASNIILKEQLTRNQKAGAAIILFGISATILGNSSSTSTVMLNFGLGEILTIISAIFYSISIIINKQNLSQIPIGLANSFRTGVGAIIFFLVAINLYEIDHFSEAFSPFLWKWMVLYGAVIVVTGQLLWAKGLRATPISRSAVISCFNPIAGILFAYLILAESPTHAQIFGSVLILCGLILSQINRDQNHHRQSHLTGN